MDVVLNCAQTGNISFMGTYKINYNDSNTIFKNTLYYAWKVKSIYKYEKSVKGGAIYQMKDPENTECS